MRIVLNHSSVDRATRWWVRPTKAASVTQGGLGHPSADLVTLWWERPIKATSVTQGSTWSPFGGYGRSRRPRSPLRPTGTINIKLP